MNTSQSNTYSIAFWGTTPFAADILLHLHTIYPHITVITVSEKLDKNVTLPLNRVAQVAHQLSLPLFQPQSLDDTFFETFSQSHYHLSIVIAYGKILPLRFISFPDYGTINLHGSLLPHYRGASPVQTALLNGDTTTGITIMRMDEKMDHGPIVAQEKIALLSHDTPHSVFQRMTPAAINLLSDHLPTLLTNTTHEIPQDHEKASYTKILTRKDGLIDWNKSAIAIERMVRAFTPWPGTHSFLGKKRFKILECSIIKDTHEMSSQTHPPGTLIAYQKDLAVVTGNGILVLRIIQQEGKKPQNAHILCATQPAIIGSVLR